MRRISDYNPLAPSTRPLDSRFRGNDDTQSSIGIQGTFRAKRYSVARLLTLLVFCTLVVMLAGCGDQSQTDGSDDGISPFVNIAPDALGKKAFTINRYPGVAIFDYDRDGDMDFYVTQEEGGPNFLFRNEGDSEFSEVSEESGAAAVISNSTGVAACDFDNDGYQDLYVGAHGRKGDGLDYRSADESVGLREAISDRLFLSTGVTVRSRM